MILQSTSAIIDSGSSITFIPTNDYNTIINRITQGKSCYTSDSNLFCWCSKSNMTTFPTISISFSVGSSFVLKPDNYMEYYKGYGCWI